MRVRRLSFWFPIEIGTEFGWYSIRFFPSLPRYIKDTMLVALDQIGCLVFFSVPFSFNFRWCVFSPWKLSTLRCYRHGVESSINAIRVWFGVRKTKRVDKFSVLEPSTKSSTPIIKSNQLTKRTSNRFRYRFYYYNKFGLFFSAMAHSNELCFMCACFFLSFSMFLVFVSVSISSVFLFSFTLQKLSMTTGVLTFSFAFLLVSTSAIFHLNSLSFANVQTLITLFGSNQC